MELIYLLVICILDIQGLLDSWDLYSALDDNVSIDIEIAIMCMCGIQMMPVVRVFYDQVINIVKNTTTFERKGYRKIQKGYIDSDTSSMLLLEDSVAWGRASKNMQSDLVQAVEIIQVESGCLCFRKHRRVIESNTSIHEEGKETESTRFQSGYPIGST
jgi:hypothetical protein